MARLNWNQTQSIRYESGVDHGVFYPSEGPGVAWNGLISVEEGSVGAEKTPIYFDGIKYRDVVSPRDYQATITAFSTPPEFSSAAGDLSVVPGFILTRQVRSRFGFSYRTRVGDGYKLHIVYNALANPTSRSYQTLSDDNSPSEFSWVVNATPLLSAEYRPSAHYVLDSTRTDPNTLQAIADILYGTATSAPRLPFVEELVDIVGLWAPVLITANDISGLSVLTPGLGDLTPSRTPGIYRDIPSTRLAETAVGGLYRLE